MTALLGLLAAFYLRRDDRSAHVTFKNAAGQAIRSVRIDNEEGEAYTIEDLLPGRSKTIRVRAHGEDSYKMKVTFADGRVLEGGNGYVEPGYRVTETITDKAIETAAQAGY